MCGRCLSWFPSDLSYVEDEHIVFDPDTSEEAVAEREAILSLIDWIAKR
jgi:hypothetical protein